MTKEDEYKNALTVSVTRKVNLGNFENKDYFESVTKRFDKASDAATLHAQAVAEVESRIVERMKVDTKNGVIRHAPTELLQEES